MANNKIKIWIAAGLLTIGPWVFGQQHTQNESEPPARDGHRENYAVILAPDVDAKSKRKINAAYSTFIHQNFSPDNIYVVREAYDKEHEGNFIAANKEGIEQTFAKLKENMDGDDHLWLYVTGNGGGEGKDIRTGYIALQDGDTLTVGDLEKLLEPFETNTIRALFAQNYGCSFAAYLNGENRVTMAPCRPGEGAPNHDFETAWFSGWYYGLGDTNIDGKITMTELFEYAKNNGSKDAQPYLANKGMADATVMYRENGF